MPGVKNECSPRQRPPRGEPQVLELKLSTVQIMPRALKPPPQQRQGCAFIRDGVCHLPGEGVESLSVFHLSGEPTRSRRRQRQRGRANGLAPHERSEFLVRLKEIESF